MIYMFSGYSMFGISPYPTPQWLKLQNLSFNLRESLCVNIKNNIELKTKNNNMNKTTK